MISGSGQTFRSDIQGLRAVAVLLVLLFHFETPLLGGYLGVDMFFVISGFVIASSTIREIERSESFSWSYFLRRRVRRLLPGVVAVSFTVVAASTVLLSPFGPQQTTAQMLVGAATYSSNFLLMSRNYFSLDPESNPLMHFWSLAVEEQFYLLWPIAIIGLLAICKRIGYRAGKLVAWLLIGVTVYASCRLFVWFSIEGPTVNDYSWFQPLITRDISPQRFAFYSPLTRSWEFVAGVGVSLLIRSAWMKKCEVFGGAIWVIGAACVVTAVRLATITPGYEQGTETATNTSATMLVVLGTSLLIFSGEFNPRVSTALATQPLRIIGDWSYSVYLWHWPIWVFLITMFNRGTVVVVASFILSMLLGWAQFRWIEKPIRDGKRLVHRGSGSMVVGFAAIAVFGYFIMAVVTPVIGKGIAGRDPEEVSAHIIEQPCVNDEFVIGSTRSCPYTTPNAIGTALLVGDSMARSLSDGFVVAAHSEQLNAYTYSYPGCAFLISDSPFTPTLECREWRQNVLLAITQLQPKIVVISNMSTLYTDVPLADFSLEKTRDAWGYELGRTFEAMSTLGTKVIIAQPPPSFKYDLRYDVSLLRRNGIQEDRSEVVARRALINTIEVNTAGLFPFIAPIVSFDDLFCNATLCSQKIGKQFMLEDANHLSVEGSLLAAPIIQNAIASALST